MIAFIKAIPTMIAFLLQVKAFIDKEIELEKRQALLKKMGDAVEKAHTNGDTTDLEKLFTPVSQ